VYYAIQRINQIKWWDFRLKPPKGSWVEREADLDPRERPWPRADLLTQHTTLHCPIRHHCVVMHSHGIGDNLRRVSHHLITQALYPNACWVIHWIEDTCALSTLGTKARCLPSSWMTFWHGRQCIYCTRKDKAIQPLCWIVNCSKQRSWFIDRVVDICRAWDVLG